MDNNTDFFNKDFDSSIASSFATNSDRTTGLQSASSLFGANGPIPSSLSTPSVSSSSSHNTSLPISDLKQQIFPSLSHPNLPAHRPPISQPWQLYAPAISDMHNGDYPTQLVTPADNIRGEFYLDSSDLVEQEYLLAARREQEAPTLPDTTSDLINLEYSFKKDELAERAASIKLGGHTSSSNTPNSSTSSGVKTPNLLPVSAPRLSPNTAPLHTPQQVDLSNSHETVCEAPAYDALSGSANGPVDVRPAVQVSTQRLDLSGGQKAHQPPLPPPDQNTPVNRSYQQRHSRTHSDHMIIRNSSSQLHSLLTEQRPHLPHDRFPSSSNSAFSQPPPNPNSNFSSLFPPLIPPTGQPPLPLPPADNNDLEVQQMALNGKASRSEMYIGVSDPEEALPRSNSALETRFAPAPPLSKPFKKSKRSSKHRMPHVREPSYDSGSDQERQNLGGGGLPRTSSFSALTPSYNRPSSRNSETSRRGNRSNKPFPVLPKPPHITTEVPLPGLLTDPLKRSPPLPAEPPLHLTAEQRQRELPSVPDQTAPRFLPQPPRPYHDPSLSLPIGSEYPYAPYPYPHMSRWPAPAPGAVTSEEETGPGYPHQPYFPFYYPYQYMMYPPYPAVGEGTEEQQQPGYPPYPYPYYPMLPPMYPYLSHPGSRAGSYAPSMADEELTERGSIYSAGTEETGNLTLEYWQQQQQLWPQMVERDPSYLMERVSSQPISFELINQSSTPVTEVDSKRSTPFLFDYPHRKGSFSGCGTLVLTPHPLSASGVQVCGLEQLCQLPHLERHASFPGPLNSLSVKSEVVRFTQEHVTAAQREGDTDGALLWEYLSRLCAQNGVLVPSDVVELLSRGGAFSIRGSETQTENRQVGDQLRLLVLQRRIKEAVELCITQQMWTHALLLAQTLDEHTRASVQDRFTYSLHASDPLQCYYSAVVGKRPHGVHASYLREGHSWKQHLAMLISHRHLPASETSIFTLADNLTECGHTHAAHLVRLIQGQLLGGWGDPDARYSLLGVEGTGMQLSTRCILPEELHKTEVYEYARSLSNSDFSLPGFQSYKYQLACLYAEAGLTEKAFSYCEAIFVSVQKQPCSYSVTFLSQLLSLSDRLHGSLLQLPSTPVREPPVYPRWISILSSFIEQQKGGGIYVPTPSLPLLTPTPSLMSPYRHPHPHNTDSHTTNNPVSRQEYPVTHPLSHPPHSSDNLAGYQGVLLGSPDDDDATTESYKSAADESLMGVGGHNTDEEILDFDIPSLGSSPLPPGMISGPQSPSESINRSADSSGREETGGGLMGMMGNIVGRIRSKSNANKNQMRLPKSDRFYFDEDKKKWIDKEGGEEHILSPTAPPKDSDLRPRASSGAPLPPSQLPPLDSQGILSHNPRSRYVDVLNKSSRPLAAPAVPLFPTSFDTPFSGTLFIPQTDPSAPLASSDSQDVRGGRGSPDAVSVTTASISEASKEVRQIMRNTQHLSNPHPAGMRY